MVQLVTSAKRKVFAKVEGCEIKLAEHKISTDLNILPLGSYYVLIGMDWLERQWALVNCKYKTINFLSNNGSRIEVQGVKREVNLRSITTHQLARCMPKDCQIYVVHVGFTNSKDKVSALEEIPIIQEFKDVFP